MSVVMYVLTGIKCRMSLLFFLTSFIFFVMTACSKDDVNILTVDKDNFNFSPEGGSMNVVVHTDAKSWSIDNPGSDWLTVTPPGSGLPTTIVNLRVSTRTLTDRSATLIVSAGSASPVKMEVTQSASDFLYKISADLPALEFKHRGETKPLMVTTDGAQWSASTDADWLELSKTSGTKGTTMVNITALESIPDDERTATITITGDNTETLEIPVTQKASIYPNYNTTPIAPDATGMSSNAIELAAKMKLGWNIGNTLEAIGGENAWGNPDISKEYVEAVKSKGFNAIRLPCSWNQYSDQATAKIQQEWIDRVKEVVGYCVDNDMYVLLNIHWDGGWLENNCTPDKKDLVNAKQKAFWEQIATAMRDFDEHLMFASANEPNVENAVQMEALSSYHQTFVNAVRSTGGRNSYRVLVVQGPGTNIEKSDDLMDMPMDEIEGRLMAEVHFYSPSQFCILLDGDASWGKMFYYWGAGHHSTIEPDRNPTWGEEDDVDKSFSLAKKKFVDNGIPVILGEYGAYRRNNAKYVPQDLETHNDAVDYWITYITKQAIANGVIPFWWDTGGALDRANYTVKDQRTIDAIIAGTK